VAGCAPTARATSPWAPPSAIGRPR
jgi:hypothetical protein